MKHLLLTGALLLGIITACSDRHDYKLNSQASQIVDSLSRDSVLFDRSIYKYVNLLKVATNEDLVHLTYHEKPIVRCYAFTGLAERNYPKIRDVFFDHINDTTQTVYINAGHLQDYTFVRTYMLLTLHPVSSKSKYKFTRPEFDPIFEKYYNRPAANTR